VTCSSAVRLNQSSDFLIERDGVDVPGDPRANVRRQYATAGLCSAPALRRFRLRSRMGWTLTVPTVEVPSRAATIAPVAAGVADDVDLEHELTLRGTKLGMTDKQRTTGRLRSPWARRWARLGLAVFGFGGAAVVMHFWMGQSWRYVLVMGASLAFVLVAAQEVLEARGRGRAGQ